MILKENFYIIFFFIILNILLYFLKDNFYQKFLPLDKPHNRKIHKNPVLINGGFIFYVNIFFLIIISNFKSEIFGNFNENKIIFLLSITFFFLLGLFDDKVNLKGNIKLLLMIILIFFFLNSNKIFLISELKFSFYENSINLGSFSIFFTILCISLFINSFNMFDGINLQSGFYSLTFFAFFIIKNYNFFFCLILILPHIFFLLKNFKNKSFLGDGGCYILSFTIGLFIIDMYNQDNIKSDQIFLLMLIPGIDMFRLFLFRIYHKKNPFSADKNHLHHILLERLNSFKTFIIIYLINLYNFISVYLEFNSVLTLIISLTIYLAIVSKKIKLNI